MNRSDETPTSAPRTSSVTTGRTAETAAFGDLLRTWRTARRYTQLGLAEETQVSQRHLSFLESGRARPSREMVSRLALALGVPLREQNELMVAAGYAPPYRERDLKDADMVAIRQALDSTLQHHEPYPALVIDRQWNVVMHNAAVNRLIALVGDPATVWGRVDPSGRQNLMRLTLHPDGLQPLIVDWASTVAAILARLALEVQANPANMGLQALLADLRRLPGVPRVENSPITPASMEVPVLSLKLRSEGLALELFSMICTVGAAMDLTADELRLELLFPSDGATALFLRTHPQKATVRPAQSAATGNN